MVSAVSPSHLPLTVAMASNVWAAPKLSFPLLVRLVPSALRVTTAQSFKLESSHVPAVTISPTPVPVLA